MERGEPRGIFKKVHFTAASQTKSKKGEKRQSKWNTSLKNILQGKSGGHLRPQMETQEQQSVNSFFLKTVNAPKEKKGKKKRRGGGKPKKKRRRRKKGRKERVKETEPLMIF